MSADTHIILPEPSLRRLPWYLAYVDILRARGLKFVSSTKIARALSVEASQIAKDLSFLNIKGKTRIGYETATLSDTLADFLGFKKEHRAYVMGVGSLGSALLRDSGLVKYGLKIVAGFDVNRDLSGQQDFGMPIYHPDDLDKVMDRMPADICILAVPAEVAQEVADMAIAAGIRAIWNFTPYRVKVAEGVVMANTSIYAHLAIIYNRLENLPR